VSKGTLGFKFITANHSRDNLLRDALSVAPHTCVVVDDPVAAQALIERGVRVIYRRSDDDHAQDKFDAVEFVNDLHGDAPSGALLYLGNEPGRGDLVKLSAWTMEALDQCDRIGRKGVIFNIETGVPEPSDWQGLRAMLARAKRGGHVLGVHEYFDKKSMDAISFRWHIGRAWQDTLGMDRPEILVTELGCAVDFDAYRGWRSVYGESIYADQLMQAAAWYASKGIAVCIFCLGGFDKWLSFDVQQRSETDKLMTWIKATNDLYPVAPLTPAPPPPPTPPTPPEGEIVRATVIYTHADIANVRREPSSPQSPIVKTLRVGDVVQYVNTVVDANGRGWYWLASPQGWVAASIIRFRRVEGSETNLIMLDVPFVNQTDGDANLRWNDCGPAAALIMRRFVEVRAGLRFARFVTVDRMIDATPLAMSDKPLARAAIRDFLDGMGVDAALASNLTIPTIRTQIERGQPVIALVAYGDIVPSDPFNGGHYVVVTGISDQYVYAHDPYKGGPNLQLPHALFDAALRNVVMVGASSTPYLGIVLVDVA